MAMSGIKILDECKDAYSRSQKDKGDLGYVIYKIRNESEIYVAASCTRAEFDYEKFYDIARAAPLEPFYATMIITKPGDNLKAKVILLTYINDDTPIKKRMIYSSSKDTVKNAFKGFHKDIHVNDLDELAFGEICKALFS